MPPTSTSTPSTSPTSAPPKPSSSSTRSPTHLQNNTSPVSARRVAAALRPGRAHHRRQRPRRPAPRNHHPRPAGHRRHARRDQPQPRGPRERPEGGHPARAKAPSCPRPCHPAAGAFCCAPQKGRPAGQDGPGCPKTTTGPPQARTSPASGPFVGLAVGHSQTPGEPSPSRPPKKPARARHAHPALLVTL